MLYELRYVEELDRIFIVGSVPKHMSLGIQKTLLQHIAV